MKRIVGAYLFILSLFPLLCHAQEDTIRFSLEDCLEYAFGNSYTRKSMLLGEELKEETYNQSKLERLPGFDASLSEGWSHSKQEGTGFTGSLGVSTSVTLYQGGTISNTIESNKLAMEQARYQTQQYDNELAIKILESFLTVLGNEELLKYQEVVLLASEEQLKQGKAQYEAGVILESDYLMLESQYASGRSDIVDTGISRDNSLLSLKSLMSMEPEAELRIIYPDTTSIRQMQLLPSREFAVERAMITLPDLKISQYDVDLANMDIKLAKAGYLPTISLGGRINTGHNDFDAFGKQLTDRLGESVSLSVSIPIWDKGKTKLRTTQSRIALQQAEYDRSQTELNLRQLIIQEHQNVVSAMNRYQSNIIKEEAYSKTFEAYRAMFNVGTITPVELLQQQNNYISAMNDYVQSKYSFILRRKILDIYMGELIKM
jgi:Outer membrane protein